MTLSHLRILVALLLPLFFYNCSEQTVDKGVSFQMATARKQAVKEVDYYLYFDIPEIQTEEIQGRISIHFKWDKTSEPLYLDFNESEDKLINLKVNGKQTEIKFDNEHILVPANMLSNGGNDINIEFIAGDLSLNRNADYLYTLFVPDRASTCFPGFDQPDIKANYKLELLVPKDWEAISNGASNPIAEKDNKKLYAFSTTKPISTYQFAFATGKFKKITDELSGMNMYYRETDSVKVAANLKDIFLLHSQSKQWLEQYTSIQYPFQKLDFVLIPTFQYGGMEHPGNIFYRESSLILEETASINQKLRRASLIAHETAHMWFGNLVTMKWFNDVWLKEVFANFMAAKIVNPQFPEIDHDLRFLLAHYPTAYSIDRSDGSHPIQQKLDNLKNAGSLYGGIIYQKAPIMMRNLETIMGKENFQKGLQDYLSTYSYDNATWDDLVNSLNKFTNKDLDVWNKAWIKSKGMPVLEYEAADNFKIQVVNDTNKIVWPQVLQYQLNDGNNSVTETIDIESADGGVIALVLAPTYVIPNYGGRGYGYFKADEPSRQKMLDGINTIKSDEARAGVWLNIWEYTLRNELNTKHVLETILVSIGKEKNPLILEYIANNLQALFWQFTRQEDRQLIGGEIDKQLFGLISTEENISLKRIYFNCFRNIASSKEGIVNLEKFWRDEINLGLDISEQDHIQLAYELAVRDVSGSDSILQTQLRKTKNPDRKAAMAFIIPALSIKENERDEFFDSLKDPKNREHEPWVLEALNYLHHPLRQKQSIKYMKPSLEMLAEIQLTGDIFFPKGWVDQTVSGYQSKEAAGIVRQFLNDNPTLSPNLKNKLLQSADVLFRAEKIVIESKNQSM